MLKEFIRRVIWYACEMTMSKGEWAAKPGTAKYRFLNWLYGDGAPCSDGWEYPEDVAEGGNGE